MSEAKEPSGWKCESDVLKYINGTPALLSLLYDLDLLPEQVTEGRDKFAMLSTATHFKSAIDAALADQSHAPASRLWVSRREHEQEVVRLMDLLQREREIGKMLEGLLDRRCPGWRKLQPCAGSSSSKK